MPKNTPQINQDNKSDRPILQFSVLCDGVAQQEQNSKMSLMSIFTMILQPGILPQFFLVNKWTYGKGTFEQHIVIRDPDLKTLVETEKQGFKLHNETQSHDVINGFVNVNFSAPGVYWVEVYLDDKLSISYPLPVHTGANA